MSRCQRIINQVTGEGLQLNTVCNSTNRLNRIHFNDPGNKFTFDVVCCQKCSDWIYNKLTWSERMWKEDSHLDYESKREEMRKVRWDNCRLCNHTLGCRCNICKNDSSEVWCIIFFANSGKFRGAFHLHRKCCRDIM